MDVLDRPAVERTHHGRRPVVEAVLAVAVLAVWGVLGGIAWWWIWEPSFYTVLEGQGAMAEIDLSQRFSADGWYAVIAGGLGLLSGLLLTWRLRADRLATLAALLVGSAVAVLLMTATGMLLGPGDTDAALAAAEEGSRVPIALEVGVPAFYLAWPVLALFGACLVLWGGSPDRNVGRGDHADDRARS